MLLSFVFVLIKIVMGWLISLNGNIVELKGAVEGVVTEMPWLFGLALFVMSILLYSHILLSYDTVLVFTL